MLTSSSLIQAYKENKKFNLFFKELTQEDCVKILVELTSVDPNIGTHVAVSVLHVNTWHEFIRHSIQFYDASSIKFLVRRALQVMSVEKFADMLIDVAKQEPNKVSFACYWLRGYLWTNDLKFKELIFTLKKNKELLSSNKTLIEEDWAAYENKGRKANK